MIGMPLMLEDIAKLARNLDLQGGYLLSFHTIQRYEYGPRAQVLQARVGDEVRFYERTDHEPQMHRLGRSEAKDLSRFLARSHDIAKESNQCASGLCYPVLTETFYIPLAVQRA